MDQPSLYDDDIVAWAEQQAAAVRALAARPDLSNALDWENVAEEIESVGRSQVKAVEGLLTQLLAHLIKTASAPTAPSGAHLRREIVRFQVAARNHFEPSMRQRVDPEKIWNGGLTIAESDLTSYGDVPLPGLPDTCPLVLDVLLSNPFDVDAALLDIVSASDAGRRGRR